MREYRAKTTKKENQEHAFAFIGNTYHAKATITQQKSGLPIGE